MITAVDAYNRTTSLIVQDCNTSFYKALKEIEDRISYSIDCRNFSVIYTIERMDTNLKLTMLLEELASLGYRVTITEHPDDIDCLCTLQIFWDQI
jgi:hypothetical protein